MKKIGVMQPYFVPYIGYWQLMNAVDVYVVYDDVNYINRGWINRNKILVNGEPQYINLLLSGASQNKLINEISLADNAANVKKIFRTLEMNYKKAPFYKEVFDLLEKILNNNQINLALFLYDQIKWLAEYMEMDTQFVLSSALDKDNSLRGQDKILDICRCLCGTEYYNAIGGQSLYSREKFSDNGIKLFFLETDAIRYHRGSNLFVGGLSILDVLMYNDKEQIHQLLNQYKLL